MGKLNLFIERLPDMKLNNIHNLVVQKMNGTGHVTWYFTFCDNFHQYKKLNVLDECQPHGQNIYICVLGKSRIHTLKIKQCRLKIGTIWVLYVLKLRSIMVGFGQHQSFYELISTLPLLLSNYAL